MEILAHSFLNSYLCVRYEIAYKRIWYDLWFEKKHCWKKTDNVSIFESFNYNKKSGAHIEWEHIWNSLNDLNKLFEKVWIEVKIRIMVVLEPKSHITFAFIWLSDRKKNRSAYMVTS